MSSQPHFLKMNKKQNIKKVIKILEKRYPETETALLYKNKFQLLVATILSAQCTDIRVNIVTSKLFKKFKTTEDFAKLSQKKLANEISSVTYFNSKAKNIINSAKKIIKDFNGKVPDSMENLITLPGVGRKTANVVLAHGFGRIEGVTVDTHVARLSQRLGFTEHKNPEKIEKDLMKLVNTAYWDKISMFLIFYGREICSARNPNCKICILNKICPSYGKFIKE